MANARGMKPTSVETVGHYTTKMAYDGSNNLEYLGKADIGTATSSSGWQIKKFTYSGTNLGEILFAEGSDAFDKIWDNRTSYGYS